MSFLQQAEKSEKDKSDKRSLAAPVEAKAEDGNRDLSDTWLGLQATDSGGPSSSRRKPLLKAGKQLILICVLCFRKSQDAVLQGLQGVVIGWQCYDG